MPGPITHTAVALLARDRIRQIRDALRAKERNGRVVNDIERQVRYLAEKAFTAMTNATPTIEPPVALYGVTPNDPAGDQVSKFLLMGAIGPDIHGYAALFAPNQRWLRDTLHKGTPDVNREQVLVGSSNFAFSFWRRVQPEIANDYPFSAPNTPEQRRHDDALAGMQAYLLGHFCHVATDMLSAPYIDNLEWRLGTAGPPAWTKLSREDVTGALDVEVARRIFRRGDETRGGDWVNWWPTEGQVPRAFYKATKEALEEIYGTGAIRPGLAAYEEERAKDPPPPLSEDLLRDGYGSFRNVVDSGVAWDYWDWLTATWFMFLPSFVAYPLALALPNGKDYFRTTKPADYNDSKALFEIIALPFAVNSLVPLYYSIIATRSYLGAESEVIVGWVSTGVQLVGAIGYLATLDTDADKVPWRYGLVFGVPLLLYAIHIGYTWYRGTANPRRRQLLFASILPVLLSFAFIGLYFAFLHTGVEKIQNPEPDKDEGAFVSRLVAWFVILFALWWIVAALIRWFLSPRIDAGTARDAVAQQGHHIRLFDDTTLWASDPNPVSPTLADLFYPSGRRALLKLWWDGAGAATIIAHRDRLEFNLAGHTQIVPVPPVAMKVSEFADYLQRNVKDAGGNASLRVERFHAETEDDVYRLTILTFEDHDLPPGLAFSDEGDNETTETARAAKVGVAQLLRASTGDPYVLYHAPKAHQSVRFDRHGRSLDTDESTAAVNGIGTVTVATNSRRVTLVPGPNNTKFTRVFRPGDLIEVPPMGTARVVVSVESDEQLTVSAPFPAALASSPFRRAPQPNRREAPVIPAGWQVDTDPMRPSEIRGIGGTDFGTLFKPGDTITITPPAGPVVTRVIQEVVSATTLLVAERFAAPLMPSTFGRVPEEPETLIRYMAGPDDTLESGSSIMNHAADLAALLCLGATSQLLSPGELGKSNIGSASDLNRVYQVFRNWNLDRRRENEWKMLILGGAVSEKRGDTNATDPALPSDAPPAVLTAAGEATANAAGWVNVLRSWVEMARSPLSDTSDTSSFRPGNPSNLELSRAMAFLLDMRDPGGAA